MRIIELSKPDMVDARKRLHDAGYSQLGRGNYATIWWKPNSSYVLKLFWSIDTAYIDFVKLAMQHNNPHFPKFKGNLVKITDKYSAIRMEKLEPLDYDNINSRYANLFDRMDYYVRAKMHKDDQDDFLDDYPSLKEACDLVVNNLYVYSPIRTVGHGHHIDFHPGNVMLRGDTLVIIDPVNNSQ